MLFSDLMPIFGALAPRIGGPQLQLLPKAQSNATGGNIPGVKTPPLSSPSDYMNAATAANSANYENRLRDLQGQQLTQQMGFSKELATQLPQLMAMLNGGGAQGQPQGDAPAFGALAPASPNAGAPSSGAGAAGPDRASIEDAKAAALRAGFQGTDADKAAAIGMAESSGNLNAANEKGEHSYGYMQINADAHGPKALSALGDLDRSMQLAYQISKGGTDFSPWTMYRNGQYKQHMGAAQAAGNADTLPGVPDFGGRFAGNEGAAYAPLSLGGAGAVNEPNISGAPAPLDGNAPQPVRLVQNGPIAPGSLAPGYTPANPNRPASAPGQPDVPAPPPGYGGGAPSAAPSPSAVSPQMMPGGAFGSPVPGQGMQMPSANAAMTPLQRAIVQFGVLSRMAKLGDVATPLEQAFYNSPAFKGQVAAAENRAKYLGPEADPALQGTIAGQRARAQFQASEAPKIQLQTEADISKAAPIAGAQAGAQQPYTLQKDWYNALLNNATESNKPVTASPNTTVNINPNRVPIPAPPAGLGQPPQYAQNAPPAGPAPDQAQAGTTGTPAANIAGRNSAEIKTEEGRAETLGTEYGDIAKAQQAADKALPDLLSIEGAANNYRTGPSADARLRLQKALQDFAQTIHLNPGDALAQEIASGEIIKKSGTRLGFELARTLGSREAQNIVQQAITTNPGLDNSPEGNIKLIGLIKAGLQRDQDKRLFYDNWYGANKNYEGAATAFNKAAPVQSYISSIIPQKVSSEAQYNALPGGTQFVAPDGKMKMKPFDPLHDQYLRR